MPAVSVETLRREFDGSFALPQRDAAPNIVHLLAIRVGTQPYALRVSELGALAADRRVTPVPSPTAALSGLVGLRGVVVAVFDLAILLGEAPGNEGPRWLALCGADAHCALGFSTLEGHLRVPLDALRAKPGERQGLVEHVLESEGELRSIASVPRIVRTIAEGAGQHRPEKGR
jgi:chemotaxis signal transduction protein